MTRPMSPSRADALRRQRDFLERCLHELRELVDTMYRPALRGRATESAEWNQLVDYRASRRGTRLYVKAIYRTPPARGPVEEFEMPVLRLGITHGHHFKLDWMRGNDRWQTLVVGIKLEEAFGLIRSLPMFEP
jgi:hypothetical protein